MRRPMLIPIVIGVAFLALFAVCHSLTEAQGVMAPTRTELQASPNPVRADQTLTLSARVYPIMPNASAATGEVQFFDGRTLLGTATLTQVNGVATASLTVVDLEPGPHPMMARYRGDSSSRPSDSVPPLPQLVTEQ
jgi:hypothetical protein